MLGSSLCVPQKLGPTQRPGILPSWLGQTPIHSERGQVPIDLKISIRVPLQEGSFQEVKETLAMEHGILAIFLSFLVNSTDFSCFR